MNPLLKLLKEAVEVSQELKRLGSNQKLSASGFLSEAFNVAKTDDDQLDELEDRLQGRSTELDGVDAYLRRSEKWVKEGTCTRFPQNLSRIRWLFSENTEAELSILGVDPFVAFALAVRNVTQLNPEVFGEVENWDKHCENFKNLENERKFIYKKIDEAYSPHDLDFDEPDANGRVGATFKITNGEVPIGTHAGERLVKWAMENPQIFEKGWMVAA